MFRTYPQAELPGFTTLAPDGERTWSWIELPLNLSRFLVSFDVCEDGDPSTRTFFCNDVRHIRSLQQALSDDGEAAIRQVSVLAPDHVHGGDGYKLVRIRQIKACVSDPNALIFILDDDSQLLDTFCMPEAFENEEFETIAEF